MSSHGTTLILACAATTPPISSTVVVIWVDYSLVSGPLYSLISILAVLIVVVVDLRRTNELLSDFYGTIFLEFGESGVFFGVWVCV